MKIEIEYDEAKRLKTLQERGLDFNDAPIVFASSFMVLEDDRTDYGEARQITFGFLNDRLVAVVWTDRGQSRRINSMRHAHDSEIEARKRALD